jgi:prepilin peptidase CpaA
MTCLAYVVLQVCSAGYDLWSFRIPNILPLALVLLFLLATLPNAAAVDWPSHLSAAALIFAAGATMFRFRLMGGGDVKLLSATALWVGLPFLLDLVSLTALFGGLLVLILKLGAPTALALLSRLPSLDRRAVPQALAGGRHIPYGVAIVAAALALLDKLPAAVLPF